MKKASLLSALAILSGITLLNSCSKPDNTAGPQGPAGPSYTGSISGHVTLYNQYGDIQPAVLSKAVRVVLYNASYTAVIDSVNADSTGKYVINNVSTGVYNLSFRDTSYGQELHEDFQFLGGSQALEVDGKLSQVPTFTFTVGGDSIHRKVNDTLVYVYGTVSVASSQARDLAVFIGTSSNVSSTPGTYSSVVATISIPAGATTFNTSIAVNSFYLAGLSPGQMAYINVYAASVSYASTSEYENYTTGQTTYNALGGSAIATPVKL